MYEIDMENIRIMGACSGMAFLQNKKILHRDLACRNLLVDLCNLLSSFVGFKSRRSVESEGF